MFGPSSFTPSSRKALESAAFVHPCQVRKKITKRDQNTLEEPQGEPMNRVLSFPWRFFKIGLLLLLIGSRLVRAEDPTGVGPNLPSGSADLFAFPGDASIQEKHIVAF